MDSRSWKVTDGGLATEVIKLGFNLNHSPLWSASLLHTDTAPILEVHKKYLEAGAEVITSASYQASIGGFMKYLKISAAESEALIEKSIHLCYQAREQFIRTHGLEISDIMVAGSVGPYGAALADGSEYTGNYVDNISIEELISWHRPRVSCLVRAGCDLLAFETIPAVKEGIGLMQLLREFPGTKAWLSFSCQYPTETAHKENFSEVVKSCLQVNSAGQLLAIGVNCSPPDYIESLASLAVPHAKTLPIIAYPNSGEIYRSGVGWTGEGKPVTGYIRPWLRAGVKWFGGCCRTTPEDIATIRKELQNISPSSK